MTWQPFKGTNRAVIVFKRAVYFCRSCLPLSTDLIEDLILVLELFSVMSVSFPSKNIEGICFFEVNTNTKYISSRELKTSEFSRVRRTSENFYVFNSRDEIYLVFAEKKANFLLFYNNAIRMAGGKNAKTKNF